jgi:hypothetical protein
VGFLTSLLLLQTLQPHCADYTDRTVRIASAAPLEPSRPKGVGVTALAMSALAGIYLIQGLLHLFGVASATPAVFEQLLISLGRGLEILLIWNYWKGQDWARICVLLWSFAIAARELSALVDHNGDLTALMSHPLRFFHALLSVFLLYWLNTAPVRAWFKKMSATTADLISDHLAGKLCTAVVKRGVAPNPVWHLAFEHEAELTLSCPWRMVVDDNLAFASNPVPESSFDDALPGSLLPNLRVKAVRVTPRTSDLFVTFEMGIEIQTWSTDPQAQLWRYSDPLLAVTADSVGLSTQAIAAPLSTEEHPAND